MGKKVLVSVVFAFLLSGCATATTQTQEESNIDLAGGQPSAYEEIEKEEAEQSAKDERTCDIQFVYHNDFYGYDLKATWSDVKILKTNTNSGSEINGLELLFDGSKKLFDDLDMDDSGNLSKDEWEELDADFPFEKSEVDKSGAIEYDELLNVTYYIGGMDVYPTGFEISQPTMEGYSIELNNDDGPVSIKILRASTPGYAGAYGYFFPEGTVFVELASDFRIFMPVAGDMEVTSAFDYPGLNMYIDDGKEVKDSYSHGAMGFTSVVDIDEFNGIFSGKPFSLQYDAYYDGKVVGTYDLTISPQ